RFRRDVLRGEDEVAFVLPLGVVDQDHHPTLSDLFEGALDPLDLGHVRLRCASRRRATCLARMSVSTLRRSPARFCPSVVGRSVSRLTSAEKAESSQSTTVRQAPSTAMLFPSSRSLRGRRVRTVRRAPPPCTGAIRAIVPMSSTNPVNTPWF